MNCKELTVERLLVRDPTGRGTVEIKGTEIVLCDERQDPRLILRLDPDHCPSIHLLDAIRTERIQLQVRPNGAASIHLNSGHERPAIWLTTDCGTRINLFDDGGTSRLDCYLDEDDGYPVIALGDKRGEIHARLTLNWQSAGVLTVSDASGKTTGEVPAEASPDGKEG